MREIWSRNFKGLVFFAGFMLALSWMIIIGLALGQSGMKKLKCAMERLGPGPGGFAVTALTRKLFLK